MFLLRSYRHPGFTIATILAITLFFGMQLPKLVTNNDVIIFLPKNNPHRRAYDALNAQFGKSDGIIIAATARKGLIYQQQNLIAQKQLCDALLSIDSVDDVLSLTSIDYVEGVDGAIQTFPLVRDLPSNREEEEAIRSRLDHWSIYRNTLYTQDYATSMILVRLREGPIKEDERVYRSALEITRRFNDVFDFRIAGAPSIFVLVGQNMTHDLSRLVPFVILVVLATLWLSFRRPGGIVLPMVTVAISTVWALGLMSLLGIEMTMIATVIPVLLVAVGSAYGIHIMSHYYDELEHAHSTALPLSRERHERILESTVGGVGTSVTLAALTTMTGFGSLATSGIIPVRDFGIFTTVGVLAAFIVAVTLIPSILHFVHGKRIPLRAPKRDNPLVTAVLLWLDKATHHPRGVIAVSLCITAASIAGTMRIKTGNAIVNFFKPSSSVWQNNTWLQSHTNGTSTLSIVITGSAPGDIARPEVLRVIDDFSRHLLATHPNVGKTGSIVDLIKRINVVMHAEEVAADSAVTYNEIPTDPAKYGVEDTAQLRQLISQYLMLFSGDVNQFADDGIEPRIARVLIQMNTNDVDTLRAIRSQSSRWLRQNLPSAYTFDIAGTADAEIEVNRLIVNSQITSILFSLVTVFALLAFFFRSFVAGLCGMICLSLPLLINFGVMGAFGVRLDIATAMVSSIAIGIGIDYMIHYMSAYSRELTKSKGAWEGVSGRTTRSCGKAIIYNAVSVALGFAVILFSNFRPLNNLGAMICLTMITSSLASMTLLPVIFNRFRPAFLLKADPRTNPSQGGLP